MAILNRALVLASRGLLSAGLVALTLASHGRLQYDSEQPVVTESFVPYVKPIPYEWKTIFQQGLPPREFNLVANLFPYKLASWTITDQLHPPIQYSSFSDLKLAIRSFSFIGNIPNYQQPSWPELDKQSKRIVGYTLFEVPYRFNRRLGLFSNTISSEGPTKVGFYEIECQIDVTLYSHTTTDYMIDPRTAPIVNGFNVKPMWYNVGTEKGLTMTYGNNRQTLGLRSRTRVDTS